MIRYSCRSDRICAVYDDKIVGAREPEIEAVKLHPRIRSSPGGLRVKPEQLIAEIEHHGGVAGNIGGRILALFDKN